MNKLLSLVFVASFLSMNAEEDQSQLEAEARGQAAITCLHAFMAGGLYWSADSYQYLNKVNGVQTSNMLLRVVRNASPRIVKLAALVAFPVLEYFDRKGKLEEARAEIAQVKQQSQDQIAAAAAQKLDEDSVVTGEDTKSGWFGFLGR